MNQRRRACFLLALSTLAVAVAAPATGAPLIVRVYVAGPDEAVSGSRDAIQDLCSRSNVAVVVRDAAGADEALLATSHAPGLAEAYVDLRPGTAPRVVVVDGETRGDLERRTLPDDASLEVSIETVAQVVCAAVESSLATRAAPAPAAPPVVHEEPTEVTPSRSARLGPEWASQLDLFAAAADFGAGFRGGAGAALRLSRGRGPLRLGALLSFSGYPATEVDGAGGVASFGSLGARLLPTLEWRSSQALTPFVAVGAGLDWVRISAGQPPLGAQGQGTRSSIDPILSGMFGARLHLGAGVAALFALGADADLLRHRYVIRTPESSQPFFEPARVRSVGLVGLSLALDGGGKANPLHEARR